MTAYCISEDVNLQVKIIVVLNAVLGIMTQFVGSMEIWHLGFFEP
jgi:hypothetical protein